MNRRDRLGIRVLRLLIVVDDAGHASYAVLAAEGTLVGGQFLLKMFNFVLLSLGQFHRDVEGFFLFGAIRVLTVHLSESVDLLSLGRFFECWGHPG